jgi:hypothetical protein
VELFWKNGFPEADPKKLANFGFYSVRPGLEYHGNNGEMAKILHKAIGQSPRHIHYVKYSNNNSNSNKNSHNDNNNNPPHANNVNSYLSPVHNNIHNIKTTTTSSIITTIIAAIITAIIFILIYKEQLYNLPPMTTTTTSALLLR